MKKLVSILVSLVVLALGAPQTRADDRPLAYVFDHNDKWTHSQHAAELLEKAGFRVEPLPLDRSPLELLDSDLIFIGSFMSEDPRYAPYMQKYASALYNYVDKGNVLLEMAQADQTEATPPFLPSTHGAHRCDDDFGTAVVLSPDNPLMAGVGKGPLSFHKTRTIWEAFDEQGGFEVMIASDDKASRPALMEGAYGQGRIILSAIAFDKTIDPPSGRTPEGDAALDSFRAAFFKNLAKHVVDVRERHTKALEITPGTWTSPFTPGAWTLVLLPDTQIYSLRYPGEFIAQTGWIAANRERRNIKFVLGLGDITNNNTRREWENARDAMSIIDGVVPYALVPGNHDYGPSGDASTRETHLNEYFKFDDFSSRPDFGGAMEPGKLENTYHLFDAGGRKWIAICLEWGPRDNVVEWAGKVMDQHPDRIGILVTHAYMNNNDRRYDHTDTTHPQDYNPHEYRTPGSMNDGEELWQKLVRNHNFALTLNGHVLGDGTGYLASRNDKGHVVHQILANYQFRELGGEGYMRLLEFQPDGRTVRIKTYSPIYDRYMTQADQQFEIVLDLP
jgi:hypothetical protein